MLKSRRRESSRFETFLIWFSTVAILLSVITFLHPYFTHWIYLKFILICALGISLLGHLYLTRIRAI